MEIGIFVFIQDSNGKILLVKDFSRQQLWTLPGGGLEFKELPQDAAKREVKEEAGVDIEVKKLLGVFVQQKSPGIVLLFEASIIGGDLKPDGKETSDVKFFSLEELLAQRDIVKPGQLSMIHQVVTNTSKELIFNHLIPIQS